MGRRQLQLFRVAREQRSTPQKRTQRKRKCGNTSDTAVIPRTKKKHPLLRLTRGERSVQDRMAAIDHNRIFVQRGLPHRLELTAVGDNANETPRHQVLQGSAPRNRWNLPRGLPHPHLLRGSLRQDPSCRLIHTAESERAKSFTKLVIVDGEDTHTHRERERERERDPISED